MNHDCAPGRNLAVILFQSYDILTHHSMEKLSNKPQRAQSFVGNFS
jgi:hypothetical protein